jgi:Cysteine-rich CWC
MSENSRAVDQSLCPLCGESNRCAMEIEKATGQKQAACWCVGIDFSVNLLSSVPSALQGTSCICMACASKSAQAVDA